MKPIHQNKFGRPDGNCFEAALASILQLSLAEVPHFGPGHEWWDNACNWARKRGWQLEYLPVYWPAKPTGFYIANGPSPRGIRHSVVYQDGQLVHDPHPQNVGLTCIEGYVLVFPHIDRLKEWE